MKRFTTKEHFLARFNFLPTAVYDSFPAVLLGRALVLAHKLGLFEAVGDASRSASELSTSLNIPINSLDLLLPSLAAAGYLKESATRYTLTAQSRKWLIKSAPQYIGNFLAYIEVLHGRWMNLEETLRLGHPSKSYVDVFSEQEWRIYTLGMMDLAKMLLPHVLPKLTLPSDTRTLIDAAGSHGLYSIALCRLYPNLTATVVDFPEVLSTTEQIIREHRMENRISLRSGDITRMQFDPSTFDVALAFNIVHGFSPEVNGRVVASLAQTLAHGGRLFILDQLKSSRRSGIDGILPLLVGLNLLNEIGGNVYSFEEVKTWCEDAGLKKVKLHRLRVPGVHLIEAMKK